MNKLGTILSLVAVMTLSLAIATFVSGCGKKKTGIDVSAQIEVLKGTDAAKKTEALGVLSQAGTDAAPAVPVLITTLKDPEPLNRSLAATILGQIGEPAKSALPALREAKNDTDIDVVKAAVTAIGNIDPNSPEAKMAMPNVMTQ